MKAMADIHRNVHIFHNYALQKVHLLYNYSPNQSTIAMQLAPKLDQPMLGHKV